MTTPWSDMKACFPVDDIDALWFAHDKGRLELPPGWTLCETDCSGARCVALFRVAGVIPTERDGVLVLAQVQMHGVA